MSENGKAGALIERAGGLGLQVGYDSGFLTVTLPADSDSRSEEESEVDRAMVAQLGGNMRAVFSLALGRAQALRAPDLAGLQVFIPSDKVVGTFSGCTPDGIVTVSYRQDLGRERISTLTSSRTGSDLFVIVDELSDGTSPITVRENTSQRVRALLRHADSLGLRVGHECGFTVVEWPRAAKIDRGFAEETIRQLGESMREVSSLAISQARALRGPHFVGRPVFIPQFGAFGVLEGCDGHGTLAVSYRDKHLASNMTCHSDADHLLVILAGDEEAAEPSSGVQKPARPWRNLLRRALG